MQNRLQEIDLFRGISALAVVLIHTSAVYLQPAQENTLVFLLVSGINVMPKFAVQAFIFISGFVLFYSYRDKELKLGQFYSKRLTHILIPYFFWTIVYLTYSGGIFTMPFYDAFIYLLVSLLTSKAAYHTYFILLILQFYLLFPLIKKVLKKYRYSLAFLIWSAVIYFVILYIDYYVTGLGKLHIPKVFLVYRSRFFILWYFYFLLGAYAAQYSEQIRNKINHYAKPALILTIVALVAAILDFFIYVRYLSYDMSYAATPIKPSIFIYTIFGIVLAYWYSLQLVTKENALKRFLLFVSKYSLSLYFAHPLIMRFVFKLKIIPWAIGNLFITYVLTVLITLLLARLINRNKKTATLMGVT